MKKKSSELDFLSSLEEGREITQDSISKKISVSIGFVNALIKKFLKKGIIKVQQAPYKRFVYYLTPDGFTEKSKLVLEYLNDSLSLFRSIRKELNSIFSNERNVSYILYGISEISEIAILSANEVGVKIRGVIDSNIKKKRYFGIPVLNNLPKDLRGKKIIICCSKNAQKIYFDLYEKYGNEKIITVNTLFVSKKKPNFVPKRKYEKK